MRTAVIITFVFAALSGVLAAPIQGERALAVRAVVAEAPEVRLGAFAVSAQRAD